MPDIVNIRELGNSLLATYDDTSKKTFVPTGNGMWLPSSTGLPDTPGGNDSLQIVSPLPSSISATTVDGTTYTFGATQIHRMVEVLNSVIPVNGMNRAALDIIMTVPVVESSWRNLSNVGMYPESADFPEIDGDGSDGSSVGLYQQTPPNGWGTPAQLATPSYAGLAFVGGPSGPNGGSPEGLFDLSPAWDTREPGAAAQAVQGSAFPDRYTNAYPVGVAIVNALLVAGAGTGSDGSSKLAWPFPQSSITSGYGPRINPVTGQVESLHDGVDFGQAYRTPIHAVADGIVSSVPAFQPSGYGNVCYLQHTQFGGHTTTTFYGHQDTVPLVHVGDHVSYGDVIGYVDSTGLSTGNHLHFGTWDGPAYAQSINPVTFLNRYGATTSPAW